MIVACYFFLNKLKEKQRVAHGKPAKLADRSMQQAYTSGDASEALGENAFLDMTDKENDEVSIHFLFFIKHTAAKVRMYLVASYSSFISTERWEWKSGGSVRGDACWNLYRSAFGFQQPWCLCFKYSVAFVIQFSSCSSVDVYEGSERSSD
jgi:hypothetical protein